MKERPILFTGPMVRAILDGRKTQTRRVIKPWPMRLIDNIPAMLLECPYGVPGDRLWVRETFYQDEFVLGPTFCGFYKASDEERSAKWKSPRYMPRWASRITLEVTGVRVQRVQEISDFDAFQEGVEAVEADTDDGHCLSFTAGFRSVWDHINAKRGFGWGVNPWVWVVEFKRITP